MLKFTRLEDIPEGKDYIEADPESREIRIVDTSRNILTISSLEGLEDLINFLEAVPENGSYSHVYERNSEVRGIAGKLDIPDLKVGELIMYLRQAEEVVNPPQYQKEF